MEWTLSNLHKDKYGDWAGNPEGYKPDPSRCCETVWTRERWPRHFQCNNKRGHGPEQAYCKTHDPAKVQERRAKSDAESNRKWAKAMLEMAGPRFFKALDDIAKGHNDPRQRAIDAIRGYEKYGETSAKSDEP